MEVVGLGLVAGPAHLHWLLCFQTSSRTCGLIAAWCENDNEVRTTLTSRWTDPFTSHGDRSARWDGVSQMVRTPVTRYDLEEVEASDGSDLTDDPEDHDHPGQEAVFPPGASLHHRNRGEAALPPTIAMRMTPGK